MLSDDDSDDDDSDDEQPQQKQPKPQRVVNFTMLVGENDGTLSSSFKAIKPFKQKDKLDEFNALKMTTASYIAIPDKAFVIKITLSRPMGIGTCLGGRVYIDKGDMKDKGKMYQKWEHKDDRSYADNSALHVDSSEADHYFTIDPGETEHLIEGFYCSPSHSKRMVWEKPNRKRSDVGNSNTIVATNSVSIGMVRVVMCYVQRDAPGETRKKQPLVRKPKQVAVDDRVEGKVIMSAKPGRKIHDGYSTSNKVLRKDIVTEIRLICNTFEGHMARKELKLSSKSVKRYKALPLVNLKDPRVRFQAIIAFMNTYTNEMEHGTYNKDEEGFIYIIALARYISKTLSPAGAYLLCTGNHYGGNNGRDFDYGEKYIQASDVAVVERLVDIPLKVQGLTAFFENQIAFYVLDLKNEYWNEWKVRLLQAIDLTYDSDDDNNAAVAV